MTSYTGTSAERVAKRQWTPVNDNQTTKTLLVQGPDADGKYKAKDTASMTERTLDPNNPNDKDYISGKNDATARSTTQAKQSEKLSSQGAEAAPQPDTGAKQADTAAAQSAPKKDSPSSPAKPQSKSAGKQPLGSWDLKDSSLYKSDYTLNGQRTGRQALPFMFEVQEDGKPIWQMVLPFNPENYKMTYAPRVNATLTQAGIFEDNIGISPPKFSISGVFGYVGTTLVGVAKSLDKEAKSGLELYHEMETNMLSFYERFGLRQMDDKEVTKKIDPKKKPVLLFFNFCDQEYWQVQVTQFSLNRNIQRKHLYQYEIQLTGLKRADKKDEQGVLNAMTKAQNARLDAAKAADANKKLGLWDSFMQKAGSLVKGVQGAVSSATAVFQKIQNEVTKLKSMMSQISSAVQGFSSGLTNLVHVPLDLVQTAKQTADSIMSSVDQITGLPQEFARDMRQIQRLLNGYTKKPELFVRPSAPPPQYADNEQLEILSVPITQQMEQSTGATGMQIPEETIFSLNTETTKLVASSQVQITDADTMATIASKTGVDWKQIASLNQLEYPYIVKAPLDAFSPARASGTMTTSVPAGSTTLPLGDFNVTAGEVVSFGDGSIYVVVASVDGTTVTLESPLSTTVPAQSQFRVHQKKLAVVSTGDTLLIPGEKNTVSAIITNSSDFEEALYGTDEYLDENGMMLASDQSDIATVSGMSNLEMQLWHRISTLRGELTELGHPEYGSLVPLFIGKTMTPVWQERILIECRMAVGADPRVDRIGNSDFYSNGTAIYFNADVYPINSKNPITVSLPIA